MNPVVDSIAISHQLHPVASEVARFSDLRRRYETRPDEPMRQQISNPFAVLCIGLLAGNTLHLIRIRQDQVKMTFECIPYRLPVHTSRFHRYMGDLRGAQPQQQHIQRLTVSFELFLSHFTAALLIEHHHASRDGLLVHVQTAASGINYLHRSLLCRQAKDAEKKNRHSFSCSPPGGGGTLLGPSNASSQIHTRAKSTRLSSACFAWRPLQCAARRVRFHPSWCRRSRRHG